MCGIIGFISKKNLKTDFYKDTIYELKSGRKRLDIFTFTVTKFLYVIKIEETNYDWLKNPSSLMLKISFWLITADGLYLDFYLFLF